jgi:hypothetical protein
VSALGTMTPERIKESLARKESTQGGSFHLESSLVVDDWVENKRPCGGARFHSHCLALLGLLGLFEQKTSS